jgi:phosphohistidine phosphatase
MLVPDTGEEALRDDVEEKFPTASIAELIFAVERWTDVASGKGHLTRFIRPRDLDAALGPDD